MTGFVTERGKNTSELNMCGYRGGEGEVRNVIMICYSNCERKRQKELSSLKIRLSDRSVCLRGWLGMCV